MTKHGVVGELEAEIGPLDIRLKPVAESPVDLEDPDWEEKLDRMEDPLGEAGIRRDQAEKLLLRIVEHYRSGPDEVRQGIRDLFERYRAFAWAVHWSHRPATVEMFRQHLLLFSIIDQGQDSRDAIVWLQNLRSEATKTGVDIRPILTEVADLSSHRNKHGMGSTRDLLGGIPPG